MPMKDILVPATPADLISQIIDLQVQIDSAIDSGQRHALLRKQAMLRRLAGRVLPSDDRLGQLTLHLAAARRDIHALTADLRACDDRKDYGVGFIALTQALLAAQTAAHHAFAAINAHLAPTAPLAMRSDERA